MISIFLKKHQLKKIKIHFFVNSDVLFEPNKIQIKNKKIKVGT